MGREVENGKKRERGNYDQDIYCVKSLFPVKRTRKKNFKLIKIKIKAKESKAAMYWDVKPEEFQRVSIVSNSQTEPELARIFLCNPWRAWHVEFLLPL